MTIRDEVRAMLDGPGPAAAPGDSADLDIGDVPADLIGTVLSHFADTATLADADALAPIVTAASPIPFDAEVDGVGDMPGPTVDPADPFDAASDQQNPDDHDPDDFDRAEAAGEPDDGSDGSSLHDDRDPDDFDDQEHTAGLPANSMNVSSDDQVTEQFGSGDGASAAQPEMPTPAEGADVGTSWDDDAFAVDDTNFDPVAEVGTDAPMIEFEPMDDSGVDDGFGADPDQFDALE